MPARCHRVRDPDTGKLVFIPGCWAMLHHEWEERKYFCTCLNLKRDARKRIKQLRAEADEIEAAIRRGEYDDE